YLDPYRGGQIAVAEVCRNISCSGAEPLALTDCLNFGDPEKPEGYYQLEWCVRGMAHACRVLGVPVVSGNVSLYNESRGTAIHPTPVLGGLGLLEDVTRYAQSSFPRDGLTVALMGDVGSRPRISDLAGSEYLQIVHGKVEGRPAIDMDLELRLQDLCRRAIHDGILASAHDCAEGGLAVALAECSVQGGVGFQGDIALPQRWDAALFGERQSRIVVSLTENDWPELQRMAGESGVPLRRLGTTGGDRLKIDRQIDLPLQEIGGAWREGLERAS
ncbi:MAG: AIR synthase related protein, partial [Chloroflexota bacterium]|nr:AIR synthase related protein [Chloroflexota bacterium]